jgi:protein transport protein HofC
MAVERAKPAGYELELGGDDRLLWALVAAALGCGALGAVLVALWQPWASVVILGAVAVGLAGAVVVGRARAAGQDAALWALAIATERGMPHASALEALAEMRRGAAQRRLRNLAALLDAGAPLPEAIGLVPGVLPRDAEVLIGVGWKAGRLPEALRNAARARAEGRPIQSRTLARIGYFALVLLMIIVISSFLLYFVLPKFEAIFKDFGTRLPDVTVAVIIASHAIIRWGSPIVLLMVLGDLAIVLAVPALRLGWLHGELPLTDRLLLGERSATMLRALAWVAEAGQPLPLGVAALVRYHPAGWFRTRLERALVDLSDGADCWHALRDRGLIRPADAALLEAARRAGNLPWALRTTAESCLRRGRFRLEAWLQVLTLLVLAALGLLVLCLTAAFFVPLVALIQSLSA